jgi:TPR repeat protein
MKRRTVLSLLAVWIFSAIPIARAQTSAPTQTASTSLPQMPTWTDVERKELLAKAKGGDRSSQMWLGASYEQGRFGKPDFQWFRKAAAQGDPDAQNALGQMYQDGEGVPQILQRLPNGIEWQQSTSRTWVELVREEPI